MSIKPSNVAVLDEFSAEDIEHWSKNAWSANQCAKAVHFDLELQRTTHHDDLCAALQAIEPISVSLDGWKRIVDYQWSLAPLSTIGSIRGIGGRFNYGAELTVVRRLEFPCLYIASDEHTAHCERFGGPINERIGKLTRLEYALRRSVSFSTFDLKGSVNQVFDLRQQRNLQPFVKLISNFTFNKATVDVHKKLRFKLPTLIRSTNDLMKRLLAKPESWRNGPNGFGIPAPSQIFGWYLREAGFEGVLYPSQRGGNSCFAVFPENLKGSDSVIEVIGPYPQGATCTRLDRNNLCIPPR